ncbi:MAG: hypothetical protein QOE92_678 [Chloroflexota bacterium]|nr:hypothetical protein [Chloroflexota bacterium]
MAVARSYRGWHRSVPGNQAGGPILRSMLKGLRSQRRSTAAPAYRHVGCLAGCGQPPTQVCAYVDRRGRDCGTSWCARHVSQVGGQDYCRRHAGLARALHAADSEMKDLPDVDDRSASLCEWIGNDLDGGIRALLTVAQGMRPGCEVSARALHRVQQGMPRRNAWYRTWMLSDQTGPVWRVSVSVDEGHDSEVVVRADASEIERFVPPWIASGTRASDQNAAALVEGRQYVRARILQSIAEAASRHGSVVELGDVLQRLGRTEEKARETSERSRAVLDNVGDGIITLDEHGVIESSNPSARRILGYFERELVGQQIRMIVGEETETTLLRDLGQRAWLEPDPTRGGAIEVQARRPDGETFPIELMVSDMQVGARRLFIGTFRDISERKAQMAAITFQAEHDTLTSLGNRSYFDSRLRAAHQVSLGNGMGYAVLLLDLNDFKEVNDTLGHGNGDVLLREVASRLRSAVRETDTVARLGGDEFVVLAGSAGSAEAAIETATRVHRAFDQPVIVAETSIQVELSIGVALFPEHGVDPEELLRHADVAMYMAKRSKSGSALYSSTQDQHSPARLAMMAELRKGIAAGELELHYQPQVELSTGRLSGVEGLVRWRHPRQGLLQPGDFLPLAEDGGMIHALTAWVLEEAERQLQAWDAAGQDFGLSINLSTRNLLQPDLLKIVSAMVERSDIVRRRLTLEITETVAMSPSAHRVLRQLHDLGLRLSVDDFGTGYSSLSYLRSLPMAELKIDRSFVTDVCTREDDAAIVRSTVDLGHNLDLEVVAEGVADQAGVDLLRTWGCDVVQGYFISPPLTATELAAWTPAAELAPRRVIQLAAG